MQQYALKRVLLAGVVLMLVSLVTFSLIRLLPGDVILQMLQEHRPLSSDEVERLRKELGLDRPFVTQYAAWVSQLMRGDLGKSLFTGEPVRDMMMRRLPFTLQVAVMAVLMALVIAIPVGVYSAVHQETVGDHGGRILAVLGLSLPDFWTATMVVTFGAIWLHWNPPLETVYIWVDPVKNLEKFLVPAAILQFRLSAVAIRMTRSGMLEVLRQDYIRTARAKGLRQRAVVFRHALKNAFIPVITILGQQFGVLLGGTVIVETVFALPGLGRLTLDAVVQRDYTTIQGTVMFFAAVVVLMNLVVDLTYAWFDPRIRYR
ncbi:MAG: ABC transporter permease [Candidatus Rokubacteria bacterium]|nr:ABC transporter permease [Candidatus Rokubacteria bacterium]